MAIVGGLDLHRAQITFDCFDTATGECARVGYDRRAGKRSPGSWPTWQPRMPISWWRVGTGWWFVADELARAGMRAHVADPAEAAALRGPKKRAKTDRADARHLRQLLVDGRVPESWIPPAHVVETPALGRLYVDLTQVRNGWAQRIHATLFHHGAPALESDLSVRPVNNKRSRWPTGCRRPTVAPVEIAVDQIRQLDTEHVCGAPELVWIVAPAGCPGYSAIYGVGELVGPLWCELGQPPGSARRASGAVTGPGHRRL